MMILALLVSVAVALDTRSGKKYDLDEAQQALCISSQGYLSGADFDEGDCCSFVVCNAAELNKTGFLGKCMGGTAYNAELQVCDDPKYVPGCNPADCDVPKRTTAECPADLPEGSCCVGGREPVYAALSANSYALPDGTPQFCPAGQVFSTSDCCCEFEYEVVPECVDGPYAANPDDVCCSYLQCFANGTGYVVVQCMPPSVWNDVNKTCDIAVNVMECMNEMCGVEMTDPPCPPSVGDDQCCIAGITYDVIDDTTYKIAGDDVEKTNCCPVDGMTDVQLVFNKEDCCCEAP
ncbi:unnamed protein product [Owenia fusiformis]|uniref:Uncharacterized protein n=1 Tax=Owenia fusiformis TaxID=6347 RepID=A0A8J1XNQ4_OWEFU|nr:unnamed protein product [Owenia fusiformis]